MVWVNPRKLLSPRTADGTLLSSGMRIQKGKSVKTRGLRWRQFNR